MASLRGSLITKLVTGYPAMDHDQLQAALTYILTHDPEPANTLVDLIVRQADTVEDDDLDRWLEHLRGHGGERGGTTGANPDRSVDLARVLAPRDPAGRNWARMLDAPVLTALVSTAHRHENWTGEILEHLDVIEPEARRGLVGWLTEHVTLTPEQTDQLTVVLNKHHLWDSVRIVTAGNAPLGLRSPGSEPIIDAGRFIPIPDDTWDRAIASVTADNQWRFLLRAGSARHITDTQLARAGKQFGQVTFTDSPTNNATAYRATIERAWPNWEHDSYGKHILDRARSHDLTHGPADTEGTIDWVAQRARKVPGAFEALLANETIGTSTALRVAQAELPTGFRDLDWLIDVRPWDPQWEPAVRAAWVNELLVDRDGRTYSTERRSDLALMLLYEHMNGSDYAVDDRSLPALTWCVEPRRCGEIPFNAIVAYLDGSGGSPELAIAITERLAEVVDDDSARALDKLADRGLNMTLDDVIELAGQF